MKSSSFPAGPLSSATDSKCSAGITWPEKIINLESGSESHSHDNSTTKWKETMKNNVDRKRKGTKFYTTRKFHNIFTGKTGAGEKLILEIWYLKSIQKHNILWLHCILVACAVLHLYPFTGSTLMSANIFSLMVGIQLLFFTYLPVALSLQQQQLLWLLSRCW